VELVKRAPKKIIPQDLTAVLLTESVTGELSYNDIAARLESVEGVSVSRQAIWKKFGDPCVEFMRGVLESVIAAKLPGVEKASQLGSHFGRVIVQDSTVLKLPSKLFEYFSGVSNGASTVCNARIQVVYDLLAETFVAFSIDPYSKNDLLAAPELELRVGDLVLRDRGYLINDEIQRHLNAGADCIYRHKYGNVYLDPQSGNPIDLAAKLSKEGQLDIEVLLGNAARTKVRIVAAMASDETVARRRMNAKKTMKRHSPTEDYLRMLSWTIFVTTIPKSIVSFEELLEIYGLRWRIETIFKSWKSNMGFAKIHNVSKKQLEVLVTARLAMIVMISQLVYHPASQVIRKKYGKELSMINLTKYFVRNPSRIADVVAGLLGDEKRKSAIEALAKYCAYDSRPRKNFTKQMTRLHDIFPLS